MTAESFLMLGTLWAVHATIAGAPALAARVLALHSLHWRQWEWLFFVLPFWILIVSQFVYPIGGLSNWIITLALTTACLFLCMLIRIIPWIARRSIAAGVLLVISCLAAIVIHAIVPAYPD
jgi:hypothetical protein